MADFMFVVSVRDSQGAPWPNVEVTAASTLINPLNPIPPNAPLNFLSGVTDLAGDVTMSLTGAEAGPFEFSVVAAINGGTTPPVVVQEGLNIRHDATIVIAGSAPTQ